MEEKEEEKKKKKSKEEEDNAGSWNYQHKIRTCETHPITRAVFKPTSVPVPATLSY